MQFLLNSEINTLAATYPGKSQLIEAHADEGNQRNCCKRAQVPEQRPNHPKDLL